MDFLWIAQPPSVKLFLLGLLTAVIISLVRFVRLARRLSQYTGRPISPEDILKGDADPDLLAASALANRVPSETVPEKSVHPGASTDKASAEKALHILRAAETKFLYLWETCHADVASTRRASVFTCLLSIAMVAHGAYTVFEERCANNNNSGLYCLVPTAEQLVVTFAFGLFLCAMLYLGSSFFERKLAHRKACWNYFSSRLRNELTRE